MDLHHEHDELLEGWQMEFSELPEEECAREGVDEVEQSPSPVVRMQVARLDWLDAPLPEGEHLPRIRGGVRPTCADVVTPARSMRTVSTGVAVESVRVRRACVDYGVRKRGLPSVETRLDVVVGV